ncbi:anti-anti-sigma factor [Mycobacterium scrofulaceum]|uniref:Anti-sigma factor antagonist n=1 Tax=Mycobacterium scrofulaceum TaxID=1783 RepID=A0A1X0K8A6_MYCSC|nr:anti-anti-sigma factor [Mycobacterium scrofulaceum]
MRRRQYVRIVSEEFFVTRRDAGDAVVLQVNGVVDIITAPSLATHIDVALSGTPAVLVIDLTEVDFLSSAGITVLVEVHRLTENSPTSLRVAADGSATSRPLRIVGLDEFIDLYPTVSEALDGRQS